MNSLKFSQSVLEKNPASQEANWLSMLAENQIAYIANDAGKYTPTFLAPETGSLKDSPHYGAFNEEYKRNADEIENMRVATLDEMKKLKPYDVFISYRQHGPDGAETKESKWAWELYTELKSDPRTRDLNIFFDQKSLTGSNAGWEPHIFSAIHTSKCMILLGSSLENINSRWVKNEWKRFLAYKKRGEKKEIVVLGGDAVNPLLLDDGLQEKQMISNTSGRWVENVLSRVSQACGKKKVAPMSAKSTQENAKPASKPAPAPAPEPAPAPAYTPPKKSSSRRDISITKIIIFVILGLSIFIGILGYAIPNCGGDEDTELGNDVGAGSSEIPATATFQGLKLGDTENGYAIVGNDGTLTGSVELPSEHDGKKITLIADGAFDGCSSVTSLTVPDSVTQIDAGAFEGLTKLENLTIPFVGMKDEENSDVTVGYKNVFGWGFGYTMRDEKGGVSTVEGTAYVDQAISAPGEVCQYALQNTTWGDVVFYCYKIPSSLRTVTVTKQENIPFAAFQNCTMLTKVSYTESLLRINDYAFNKCEALKTFDSETDGTAEFSGDLGIIGKCAFDGCAALEKVEFTSKLKEIGDYAFRGLKLITTLTVPDSVTKIGMGAFEGCSKLADITIPFVGNENVENQDVSAGYKYVLGWIFGYTVRDENLKEITTTGTAYLDKTVNSPGETCQYTLRNTTWGTEIFYCYHIPSTLRTVTVTKQQNVNYAAFQRCDALTSVTYETPLLKVGDYAFNGCEDLKRFNSETDGTATIDGTIGLIAKYGFADCASITTVDISAPVRTIQEYAFKGLNKMTSIVIPDTVTEIGMGVLDGCSKLADITLPFVGTKDEDNQDASAGYKYVLGWIFGYTVRGEDLKEITTTGTAYLDETVNSPGEICQYALRNTTWNTQIFYCYHIPSTLKNVTVTKQVNVPKCAFYHVTGLESITFENQIVKEGEHAFDDTTSNITRP